MTANDWTSKIYAALSSTAQPDRSGKSLYDYLTVTILELSRNGDDVAFLDGFLSASKGGPANDVQWWTRYLNLLDSYKCLNQQSRLRIASTFEPEQAVTPTVRATVLRQLAHYECVLDWDALSAQSSFKAAEKEKPLFVADGLIWAGRLTQAEKLIKGALDKGRIKQADLVKMNDRWKNRGFDIVKSSDVKGRLEPRSVQPIPQTFSVPLKNFEPLCPAE